MCVCNTVLIHCEKKTSGFICLFVCFKCLTENPGVSEHQHRLHIDSLHNIVMENIYKVFQQCS